MCAIEEKAIIFFKSVINRQTPPTKNIPNRLTIAKKLFNLRLLRNEKKRSKPIPPSFNRMPAKIIDP
jgi:hypothetical protein